jgi:hypothetical protein
MDSFFSFPAEARFAADGSFQSLPAGVVEFGFEVVVHHQGGFGHARSFQ